MTREDLIGQATQAQTPRGVVDLGIGQPQGAILPVELMARAMTMAAATRLGHPLQYGTERGDGHLRAALGDFLTKHYGHPVDGGRLLVSNGNSQAIDLCCGALTEPGDVVFVEEPTYFLALRIFADHGLRVIGIPVDDDGITIDALEAQLAVHSPRLLYCIPTAQNPTGASMPLERRQRLVELARQHEFLVLADEVYQLLDYSGTVPAPLAAQIDSGVVLSLGTFSKILAPGLRVGWIQASDDLLDALVARGQVVSGGGLNPFTAALLAPILDDGGVDQYLDGLRATLQRRLAVMDDALRAHLGSEVRYRRPDSGYFFWLRFLDDVDTAAVLPAALEAGVGFQPGPASSTQGGFANCLRLSFAHYDEADIRAAIARLGRVFARS
ncbi:MAG TPA: PLP-dependent aminotransferase family protein [Jatrophihabitantaceae bacterium]|nr:PLP-dependent aminotransferase family protein [Jatrophihabitantaceae bacterium]